jgi:hypothetical protein
MSDQIKVLSFGASLSIDDYKIRVGPKVGMIFCA